jgi:MerR family transcriptional regulator, copper efflux regulator
MNGLTIGEIAQRAKGHAETLRYYERRGLIERQPRSASNYRLYSEDAVQRVRFIKRAQALGFSLKVIKDLFPRRAAPAAECGEIVRRGTHGANCHPRWPKFKADDFEATHLT